MTTGENILNAIISQPALPPTVMDESFTSQVSSSNQDIDLAPTWEEAGAGDRGGEGEVGRSRHLALSTLETLDKTRYAQFILMG